MAENSIVQFLLQWAVSVTACSFFLLAGSVLLGIVRREADSVFYTLFHGINFVVALYAVVVTRGVSVHLLVLAAYVVWMIRGGRAGMGKPFSAGRRDGTRRGPELWMAMDLRSAVKGRRPIWWRVFGHWPGIVLGCLFFTGVFHFLPEGSNKQYDIFFYSKVAESLNATGQENLHAYNNLFDPSFHGVEPYHYLEMWLNGLLLRCTSLFLPDVQVFRFVGYTILSVCTLFGLGEFYAAFSGRRAGRQPMLFCLSFLFFVPDLLSYFPFLRHYLVYAFESNCLERPNFRTIYLYLLPFLLSAKQGRDALENGVYYCSLCVVSYLCFLVLAPVSLLVCLYHWLWSRKDRMRVLRWYGVPAAVTGLFFFLFYHYFSGKEMGGVYQYSLAELSVYLRTHRFFVGSTIVVSIGYTGFILFLYTFFFFWGSRDFLRENGKLVAGAGLLAVVSIVMARVVSFQNNAYQLAYLAYILASLTIFAVWSFFSRVRPVLGYGIIIFLGSYMLLKVTEGREAVTDVFRQNGPSLYDGRAYSARYLAQVGGYVRGRRALDGGRVSGRQALTGGYLCDSDYYRGLYFGSRNPNVCWPPVTYILANQVERNYEFCLSDTAAFFAGMEAGDSYEWNYLDNAIHRSGFYVYQRKGGWGRREALARFVRDRGLQYLIVSGKGGMEEVAGLAVRERFEDSETGEVFLVLKDGR